MKPITAKKYFKKNKEKSVETCPLQISSMLDMRIQNRLKRIPYDIDDNPYVALIEEQGNKCVRISYAQINSGIIRDRETVATHEPFLHKLSIYNNRRTNRGNRYVYMRGCTEEEVRKLQKLFHD